MTGNADDWRLFLAVPLPEAVKTRILEIESVPAISALPLRFVDPDRAHITLHFLGATPPERAELIALSLQQAFSRQRGAHLSTGELGLYPGARKPRVLWLGIDGDTADLGVLHRKAGEALLQMGMDIERRAFQAHITIGRV
ncbi:MAG: RNA 2',3'-cyclic phosphodiesterase, partial [Thermomicrobiales bacterium]